ncbi:MAG: aspartyl protease family protein [Bacteroidales bacterium]|jgi:hypothetical protein|nr:aspartyl protease family protein [Bacteroidales bacterium]
MKSYLPLQFIPIENEGIHIQINAFINQLPVRLVIDTGASHTVFDPIRIKRVLKGEQSIVSGLAAKGLGNDIQSKVLDMLSLEVGGTIFKDYHAVLVDLSPVNELFKEIFREEIHGILGGDMMQAMNTIIHYKKQKIKIGSKKYPMQVLALMGDSFHHMVRLNINGKAANFIIDTGASRTIFDISLFRDFADFTDDDLYINEQPSAGINADINEHHSLNLGEFTAGQLHINNFPVLLLDLSNVNHTYSALNLPPIDGILGSDFMLKHKAVINYSKRVLRLTHS